MINSETRSHLVYENVEKHYGDFQALEKTSFTVGRGEFFSLIGPSGSGKSTLLGVTAGFMQPSAGTVSVDGVNVVGVPASKRNAGMVFQHYSLFPHMTVAQNVAYPLKVRKMSKTVIQEKVRAALASVRLSPMADRYPGQLSGGQQQRVALARASVYEPTLLLMDEPLSALDKNLREEMQFEIKEFQRKLGVTVLYVTHDQHEAATMSDRVAIMNNGRIEQIGEPRELYDRPRNAFVAGFLGQANLFRIVGQASNGAVATEQNIDLRCEGETSSVANCSVCVRPEAIYIAKSPATAADNVAVGTVRDVVHSSGTVHYRVDVGSGQILQVRQVGPSEEIRPGERVWLSWHKGASQIIRN